jgi:hypothetical protein
MRDSFTSFTSGLAVGLTVAGIGLVMVGVMTDFPAPQKDPQALATCLKVHPERYCRITHDGLKP